MPRTINRAFTEFAVLIFTLAIGVSKAFATNFASPPSEFMAVTTEAPRAASSQPVLKPNGEIVLPYGEARLVVVCAVMQICDIALQPGESVTAEPVLADPRFRIHPLVTSANGRERNHVMVQPLEEGLRSALVIATVRRVYHLELHSHPTKYMPAVSFSYPADVRVQQSVVAAAASHEKKIRSLSSGQYLGDLNFRYQVHGESTARPLRVFDDGRQTFIQFSSGVIERSRPALLVQQLAEGEVADAINYSVDGDRYVVDHLFDRAILLAGTGLGAESISITRGER